MEKPKMKQKSNLIKIAENLADAYIYIYVVFKIKKRRNFFVFS